MRVDAPGLIAAAQRLLEAVAAVGGGGVAHPSLAADPTAVGTAFRLTTAGAELTAALAAHVAALVGTVEALTGAALMFEATNEQNAAMLATLSGNNCGPVVGGNWAPPAPPVPPDVRAPLPPPMAGPPEAISAAVHSGDPGAGELFTTAWAQVHSASRDAASAVRSTVGQLPDTLDAPMSTPAVSRHLLSFVNGFDTYGDRAHNLVVQATAYADNQMQAREAIPTPQQLAAAEQNVRTMQANNLATGGRYAVPLAQAVGAKTKLNNRVVDGYNDFHASTDAATGGQDPGDLNGDQSSDPTTADPAAGGLGGPDPSAALSPDHGGKMASPDEAGQMASLLPQMMGAVLGAAGGLAGGVLGAVTKVPETLMQAATQVAGSVAGAPLQGLAEPKLDSPDNKPEAGDGAGAPGDLGGGGGDAPVTPAGGGAPPLSVAPSTGSPPTPAVAPAGASGPPAPPGAGAGVGSGMPMGMPMGGLGGLGGQPDAAKSEPRRPKKIVVPPIPHTEDVTGRVDTDRLAAAAAATRARIADAPDNDDNPPSAGEPIVRRLVTKPPEEPT